MQLWLSYRQAKRRHVDTRVQYISTEYCMTQMANDYANYLLNPTPVKNHAFGKSIVPIIWSKRIVYNIKIYQEYCIIYTKSERIQLQWTSDTFKWKASCSFLSLWNPLRVLKSRVSSRRQLSTIDKQQRFKGRCSPKSTAVNYTNSRDGHSPVWYFWHHWIQSRWMGPHSHRAMNNHIQRLLPQR